MTEQEEEIIEKAKFIVRTMGNHTGIFSNYSSGELFINYNHHFNMLSVFWRINPVLQSEEDSVFLFKDGSWTDTINQEHKKAVRNASENAKAHNP